MLEKLVGQVEACWRIWLDMLKHAGEVGWTTGVMLEKLAGLLESCRRSVSVLVKLSEKIDVSWRSGLEKLHVWLGSLEG